MLTKFNHQHGGNLLQASIKYGVPIENLHDFSANINPLGPSSRVYEVIRETIDQIAFYPDPDCFKVKKALGNFFDLPENNFVIGNGASELIYVLMYSLKPTKVILPVPTFSEYSNAAKAVGIPIETVNLSGDFFETVTTDSFSLTENSLLILCNPNNPTGTLFSKDLIECILKKAEENNAWVMLDESFIDFVENKKMYSFINKVNEFSKLLILYSLTKFFALPGLRLGSIITNESIASILKEHKDPWSVNCFAIEVAESVLNDKDYYNSSREYNFKARQLLYEGLINIKGLTPFKPTANYIFVKIDPAISTSSKLCDYLGRLGILIRNCNTYSLLGENYVRIAVKTNEQNALLIEALKKWEK